MYLIIIEWCNKNNGFLMALLTLVYVAATIWLVHLSRKQIKLAIDLEKNRTRPFVIFDFVFERFMMCLQIKNIGQTSACNIRINISPTIKILLGKRNNISGLIDGNNINFIQNGIPSMAPNRTITTIIGRWDDMKMCYPEMKFRGTISYNDFDEKKYYDNIDIDLSLYEGLMYSDKKDINDVVKQIEEIAKNIHHIASGFTTPVVRVITEAQYRKEQNRNFRQGVRALEELKKRS